MSENKNTDTDGQSEPAKVAEAELAKPAEQPTIKRLLEVLNAKAVNPERHDPENWRSGSLESPGERKSQGSVAVFTKGSKYSGSPNRVAELKLIPEIEGTGKHLIKMYFIDDNDGMLALEKETYAASEPRSKDRAFLEYLGVDASYIEQLEQYEQSERELGLNEVSEGEAQGLIMYMERLAPIDYST